ncbi:TPA: FAD-dependent thymidylate synthase, partial [Staphylococcus aureus]
MNIINVLDKGYVRLVNHMGSDLTVVNSARVSYAKESKELNDKDVKLIKFLAREGHTSPFRHVIAQYEVYAPLMVARQWWKYVIGSSHQEGT